VADSEDTSKGSGSKQSSSKQSGSKRSSAKKSGQKSSSTSSSSGSEDKKSGSSRRSSDAPRAAASPSASPGKLAANAAQQLLELTGRATEGVIGLEKNDSGWRVQVEVVEVRRIPNTTDVLALYEIDADDKGNLQGYRRVRRYARGVPGED
jgi:hypothetical protein